MSGPERQSSIEIDTDKIFAAHGEPAPEGASPRLSALLRLVSALAPLADDAKAQARLRDQVNSQLLGPIMLSLPEYRTEPAQASASSSSGSSNNAASTGRSQPAPLPFPGYRNEDGNDGGGYGNGSRGVFGIPRPGGGLPGRPGDFDRDMYPDLGPGAPGWLTGGGGGMGGGFGGMPGGLVGPGHPIFGGGGGGLGPAGPGFGPGPGMFPPSHPPGARFDPMVPPGIGGGGMFPGRGGGRGGGAGRGGMGGGRMPGEPQPDHLRPPPDLGNEPPPDIYW